MSSQSGQTHKALLLDKPSTPFRIGDVDTSAPAPDEVVIQVTAVAINPVDWKSQDTGLFLVAYPSILGEDVAGRVVSTGSSVTRFKPSDRVLAHCHFLMTKETKQAGFQELVCVPERSVVKLPDDMKETDAVVLPLAVSTAAAGLYQSRSQMAPELDLPRLNPIKSGKTLLIWGGSSSVGTAAIQLAVASGLEVITTCSKRNFDLVEKLGAKAFDYSSLSVVGDLVEELKKGEFVGGFDGEFPSFES